MVGLSKPFQLLARGEGPTESGYNYAMEKDKGKLEWTEGKEKKGKRIALFKKWKTALWENLPLSNKVTPVFLETMPHMMTIPEGLWLNCWHWSICFFLPRPQSRRNTKAEEWARPVVHSATLGKSNPAPGKKLYVIDPTWCCVVFCCHGDGDADEENKSEATAALTIYVKRNTKSLGHCPIHQPRHLHTTSQTILKLPSSDTLCP